MITIAGEVVGNDFDVTLTGRQTGFTALAGMNFTPNQFRVASYLDRFDDTVTSGPIISLLQALDGVSVHPSDLGGAMDQLSPLKFGLLCFLDLVQQHLVPGRELDDYLASHRGPDGILIGGNGGIDYSGLTINSPEIDSGLQIIYGRLLAWSPPPMPGLLSDVGDPMLGGIDSKASQTVIGPESIYPLNVFVTGNAVLAQDFSDPATGVAHTDATTGGVQLGADYRVTPHLRVGALLGYGHTRATLDTLGSDASVDTYSPGVYASYAKNGWYANALGCYGFSSYDQNRKVAIGAFSGTAHSSPGGDQITGDLDGGYDFHEGSWTIGPTLGVQYVHLDIDGYTESGLPGANLDVNKDESDSLRSSLGGRVVYAVRDGDLLFTPHFDVSWQHEFLDQSRGHHQPVRRNRHRLVFRQDAQPESRLRVDRSRPQCAGRRKHPRLCRLPGPGRAIQLFRPVDPGRCEAGLLINSARSDRARVGETGCPSRAVRAERSRSARAPGNQAGPGQPALDRDAGASFNRLTMGMLSPREVRAGG